jgi:cell wall-associated NlpC family hydrolase/predicted esterase
VAQEHRGTTTIVVAVGALVILAVQAVLLVVVAVMITLAKAATPTCQGGGETSSSTGGNAGSFTSADATANAQTIVLTTAHLGLSQRAATIAVATAMDESSLIVLDHGDVAGPDSRGLFQQRDSWGTVAQRMDPAASTRLFLQRMVNVPGWETLPLTQVAHIVQGNQDPNVYARFEGPATAMVNRFWPAGTPAGGSEPSPELAANTTSAAGGSAGAAGCPGTGGQTKVLTTTYPVPGGRTQPVEISTPLGAGPGTPARPAIVMVHGGGFYFGDHTELNEAATAAADHGYLVLNIDYDLSAPRWTRELDQVRAAAAFARSAAPTYGIDPTRVALWGDSAGGTLVTEAALTGDHTGVQAVVSWSGAYDFLSLPAQVAGGADYQKLAAVADPAIYLGCPQLVCPEVYRHASPALSLTPGAPPAMLVNSETELVPLAQLTELTAVLQSAGDVVSTKVFPGNRHATAYTADAGAPTLAFLDASLHFTPPPPPAAARGLPAGYVAPPNPQQAAAVGYALAQLGKPYVYGATGPDSFDCSGLMLRAWHAAGVSIPRTSGAQSRSGAPVAGIADLQPGDLIFIPGSDGTASDPGHVGMYIGNDQLVNASEPGVPIRLDTVARWQTQIVGIRRPGGTTDRG